MQYRTSDRGFTFERLLDNQQKRQQMNWFRCLPAIKNGLVDAIKQVQTTLEGERAVKFEARTAPELRTLYKELQFFLNSPDHGFENFTSSQQVVREMCSKINGWFRSSKIAVGVQQTMDTQFQGKAKIVEEYTLIVGNDFNVPRL